MEERIIKDINNLFTQLFQKMKEAGYKWDNEKKELKKIEQKQIDSNAISIQKLVDTYKHTDEYDEDGNLKGKPINCMVRAYEQGIRDILKKIGQKPTDNDIKEALRTEYEKGRADAIAEMQEWSEEDENMLAQVINEIEAIKLNSSTVFEKNIAQAKINFLKSIKDRVRPQSKPAWSEEDEKEFKWICVRLQKPHMSIEYTERVRKAMSWLKSLKKKSTTSKQVEAE